MIYLLIAILHTASSLVVLAMFAMDKRAARMGRRRIPEVVLHLGELLGGWPGALLAMRWFRHKSAKRRYQVVTAAIVLLHAVGWVVAITCV